MTDKLDPRPIPNKPLWGWEQLNRTLQNTFSKKKKNEHFTFILLDYYEMEKNEIIEELEKANYNVTDLGDKLKIE